jgi:magnesium chelatase subunit D
MTALLLLATDPAGLKGASLRGMPGPSRDEWVKEFQRLSGRSIRRIPASVSEERLLGGLDFAATMSAGKPIFASGLLEQSDGQVVQLCMAERVHEAKASIIGEALDRGEVIVERDGTRRRSPSRFVLVALDEGIEDDERMAPILSERLAFRLPTASILNLSTSLASWSSQTIEAARRRLRDVQIPEDLLGQICQTAAAFGAGSLRADFFSLSAARAAAAIEGVRCVQERHAAIGLRLVLAHRATQMPAEAEAQAPQPEEQHEPETDGETTSSGIPDDVLVESVLASLPPELLISLSQGLSSGGQTGGRGGPETASRNRGRPIGIRQTDRLDGSRLNILATLKAAVPWQSIRRKQSSSGKGLVALRPEDLHVTRFRDRIEATTIFAVDASGSQAAQRLNEVKGAIELLLNDCYVRRDQVALLAFRKNSAEVLLEPTRALARVKKSLRALPGGGGTPLAAGLDAARQLAKTVARQGRVPAIVLLTDGRANIALNLAQGAVAAEADALQSARLIRHEKLNAILVDTSRRPKPRAEALARAMGARYVPLPNARASSISATVQAQLGK